MEYTKEQIEFIQKKKIEFKLKLVPSLNGVIVQFLKKYEVYVQPPKSSTDWGDVTNTLLGGPQIGLESMQVTGQKKQKNTQEWNQWKQWALDHKDFEAFRAEKVDMAKAHNSKILESLKDPKVQQELEPLMKEFIKVQEEEDAVNRENRNAILATFGVLIFLAFLAYGKPIIEDFFEKINLRYSYVPRNLVIK